MAGLSRADTSLLGRWWWSVDRATLAAIGALIGFGYVMMLAASPAVAERIHVPRDAFILKQVLFLGVGFGLILVLSLLDTRGVRRVALAGCLGALALTALTLVVGSDIKGARRWISFPGFAVQPSEFLKPFFAVTAAWLIAEGREKLRVPGTLVAMAIFALIVVLLKSQPDMGMIAVVTGVFFIQVFVAGAPIWVMASGVGAIVAGSLAAYATFAHVRARVAGFLDPNLHDSYQVLRALQAFGNGGLLGRGPGEGHVKDTIPDAHADFVFAVAGEEFGLIICAAVVAVFALIVLRALRRAQGDRNLYTVLATTGLAAGFGLQAFVNMASTLHLIPTKGMTLPFISYGGSSALSVSVTIGLMLALTRRRMASEDS